MDCINYQQIFEESLDDLIQLMKIPSVYDESSVSETMPYGKYSYEALYFMKEKALNDGFEVLEYDNHAIAIRYRSDCTKRIDVASHLDVVEPGEGWNYDPFGAVIEDGKLYGRGSQDMKVCAWLTYLALKLLRQEHPNIDCEVRIVLGCDEERTMNDLRYYMSKAGKPDFAFTPDGYFPMGIGEKGALMWRLKGEYEGIIESLDGGVQCNVIAPQAKAILNNDSFTSLLEGYLEKHHIQGEVTEENGKTKIYIKGIAAHASRPDDGHNATVDLLKVIGDVCNDNWALQMAECFSSPYGEGCGNAFEIEPMGKLTMNLGVLKIKDGICYGEVDSRYPYGITSKVLTEHLQAHCPLKVSLDYDDIPTLCNEDDPYVLALLETYRRLTKDDRSPMISGGVSYSKVYEHCVSFGPARFGDVQLAHQANEHIVLEDVPKLLEIYYEAIRAIGGVK